MVTKNISTDHPKLRLLQVIVYGSAILYFGKELFVPLSFALLISFVIYPPCVWMEKRGIGRFTSIIIAVFILVILVLGVVALMVSQLMTFLKEWPVFQMKFKEAIQEISQLIASSYGISREQQQVWLSQFFNQSGTGVISFLRGTVSASVFSGVLFVLIPVYTVLILYYRERWINILQRIFPQERKEGIREMLFLTVKAYYNFIKGMALVYLTVGILNSIGLLLLGVPHAILFGFIAAILTFIPYIGIIIGSLLPITMAWVTYDSFWYPVGIVLIFAFVQYLEANVIFPLAVSNRLNVNTLVVLIAIFAGGILWGVAGMILFVPFVGIAKLIAEHNPKLKTLAMVLGMGKR